MADATWPRFVVLEVHNYGGFFGGDTVTLEAAPLETPDALRTLVIDEKALDNVPDRHKVAAGMVFALKMDGERIDHARLLAASSHSDLRSALGAAQLPAQIDGPQVLSGRCPACERWVIAQLLGNTDCDLCRA